MKRRTFLASLFALPAAAVAAVKAAASQSQLLKFPWYQTKRVTVQPSKAYLDAVDRAMDGGCSLTHVEYLPLHLTPEEMTAPADAEMLYPEMIVKRTTFVPWTDEVKEMLKSQ